MFQRPDDTNILGPPATFNVEPNREATFMNARLRLSAAIALAAGMFAGSPAFAVDPGQAAPAFDLPLMDGAGSALSDELFSKHEYTFIVFWRSSCLRCVESLLGCERFYRTYGGEDVAVLGINTDDRDRLAARGVIESNGITFPQAQDAGGMAAASYGIPFETFTLCLVGKGGAVLGARFDPEGDAGAAMEEMLRQGESPVALNEESRAAPGASGDYGARGASGAPDAPGSYGSPAEAGTFSYHGLQRIRLLAIDTGANAEAAGLYGEPVRAGRSVQYRLEVEASKRLTRHLRAGGLLRISNEGTKVLESGPEYFGSEWGSAFAEIEAARFRLRVGYYSLAMTPLTFMRWDWDDNPRVGGDAGCGCGGPAAGALLVESLEELGPDLTVEGALASYDVAGIEALAFYAIPRRALETSYSAYRYSDAERAHYSQEIAGFEARWQRLDKRTGLFWKAGLHAIATVENRRSVDFEGLGYLSSDTWIDTWTVSATAEAPLIRYARLRGEIVAYNRTKENGILTEEGPATASSKGGGGIGGIAIEKSPRLGLAVDYLRLAPDFYAPFAALSYEADAEGVRASGRAPLFHDRILLSLFYKRLRSADAPEDRRGRKESWLAGASLDFDLEGGFGAGLGWLDRKTWHSDAGYSLDTFRRGIVANVRRDFGKAGVLGFQYERIWNEEPAQGIWKDTVNLYSLYSSIEF
jgi:peroxiredoxin